MLPAGGSPSASASPWRGSGSPNWPSSSPRPGPRGLRAGGPVWPSSPSVHASGRGSSVGGWPAARPVGSRHMFDTLSTRLDDIFTRLRARGRLNEKQIDEVLREIRLALLEADVSLKVV